MSTLPYLDTEEKLRAYTKQHWYIDIEPALVSAYCGKSGDVLIFPSDAYKMQYSPLHSACHGTIRVEKVSLVHPCVLAVLKEAHRKKEQEEKAALRKRIQEHEEYVLAIQRKQAEMLARVRERHIRKLSQETEEMKKASAPGFITRLLQKMKQS